MAWETLQTEDARLMQALSALRGQAAGLNVSAQDEWNSLAHTLESHLATIHACAKAMRIKLEMLKKHSKEEVDRLVHDILAKLPPRLHAAGAFAESDVMEYQKAAAELEQEHGKFLGFMDVVKGLFMWVETPEERVDKNAVMLG